MDSKNSGNLALEEIMLTTAKILKITNAASSHVCDQIVKSGRVWNFEKKFAALNFKTQNLPSSCNARRFISH